MPGDHFLRVAKSLFYNHRVRWHRDNLALFNGCERILDLGTGKGLFAKLAPRRIVSFDWSIHSLAQMKNDGPYTIVGNVLKLPFRDASFDGVYCADVIEHFPPREARQLLEESIRLLKPKGKLVIATPFPSQEFWCDPTHVRPYPPEALLSYCTDDAEKGEGNSPSLPSLKDSMKLVTLKMRRRPLVTLPFTLFFNEDRKKLSKLFHPASLLFMAGNVLARFGLVHPKPEGYVLVLEKG